MLELTTISFILVIVAIKSLSGGLTKVNIHSSKKIFVIIVTLITGFFVGLMLVFLANFLFELNLNDEQAAQLAFPVIGFSCNILAFLGPYIIKRKKLFIRK